MLFQNPTQDAPFGALEISEGDSPLSRAIVLRLGLNQMPSTHDLALLFPNPEVVYGHVLTSAIKRALLMCALLRTKPHADEIPQFDREEFDHCTYL